MTNFDTSVLNDNRVQDKIREVAKDLSDQWTKIESMQTYIAEAIANISEDTTVPKSIVRKIARTYHRQSYNAEVDSAEQFSEAYRQVFNVED